MKPAFIIPFYGADIGGGAETLCRRLAENLAQRGMDVEVFTTTIRSLAHDWSVNYYDPGMYLINGVTVRRFMVRTVDTDAFVPVNTRIMRREEISLEEEIDYMTNAVNSDAMYTYIGDNQKNYIYFFIPYLFGTSLIGSSISPFKSFLIPCLHNEGYADMSVTARMFDRVNGALFLSRAEMRLASSMYNDMPNTEKILMGCGVDDILDASGDRFRKKFGLGNSPFILYVGRMDATKNTPLLVDYFRKYKKLSPGSPLKLVLAGSGKLDIPDDIAADVIDLGFLSIADKNDAYAAATMLCQPSLMESFSIVIMESWLCGRPVLVHSDCDVTTEHALESGGGFAIGSFPEFYESVKLLVENPDIADRMGQNGKAYVEKNYTWDIICERFINLMDSFSEIEID